MVTYKVENIVEKSVWCEEGKEKGSTHRGKTTLFLPCGLQRGTVLIIDLKLFIKFDFCHDTQI